MQAPSCGHRHVVLCFVVLLTFVSVCSAFVGQSSSLHKDTLTHDKVFRHFDSPTRPSLLLSSLPSSTREIDESPTPADDKDHQDSVHGSNKTKFEREVEDTAVNTPNEQGHHKHEHSHAGAVSGFENMVRSVTGNDSYRFGDFTKGAVSSTTHAVEDLAKKTHLVNDDYHFGDLTKSAISSLSNPVNTALEGAERTLSLVREANIHEFVALTNVVWTNNLTDEQRREAWIVLIHLAAVAVLAYNFLSNVMAGMVVVAAWTKTSLVTNTSPLLNVSTWARFLQVQSTLNMIFGGPFLPVRAIVTIKWFFVYRRLLMRVQRRLSQALKFQYPLVARVASVLAMWIVFNLAVVSLLTALFVWFASLWTGVPMFASSC